MVWEGMSTAGVGPLCFLPTNATAAIYQEILGYFLLLMAEQLFGGDEFTFQHDLTPAHTVKSTKTWFTTYGIQVLSWSPAKTHWILIPSKIFGNHEEEDGCLSIDYFWSS